MTEVSAVGGVRGAVMQMTARGLALGPFHGFGDQPDVFEILDFEDALHEVILLACKELRVLAVQDGFDSEFGTQGIDFVLGQATEKLGVELPMLFDLHFKGIENARDVLNFQIGRGACCDMAQCGRQLCVLEREAIRKQFAHIGFGVLQAQCGGLFAQVSR